MCFQPYEAHVPYILSFLIDNNLYGMSYINLSSYRTRSLDSIDPSIQLFDGSYTHQMRMKISSIIHSNFYRVFIDNSIDGICKQSYCVFEIDA